MVINHSSDHGVVVVARLVGLGNSESADLLGFISAATV